MWGHCNALQWLIDWLISLVLNKQRALIFGQAYSLEEFTVSAQWAAVLASQEFLSTFGASVTFRLVVKTLYYPFTQYWPEKRTRF